MKDFIIDILVKHKKTNYVIWVFKKIPFIFQYQANLWHLACQYQSIELIDHARKLGHDINAFDERGLTPLHRLVESAFYKDKEILKFSMNIEFLKHFLSHRPDINLTWNLEKISKSSEFSKNNISGTALEQLVMVYRNGICVFNREDHENYYLNYEEVFLTLCNHGANVNFLFEGEDLGKDDILKDAMQKQTNRIMSHFFFKYLDNSKQLYALRPFLKNRTTDFQIQNETGDNLLHLLFSRLTKRNHLMRDRSLILDILKDICNNPAFSPSLVHQTNNFYTTPLQCFEDQEFKDIFLSAFMADKLEKELKEKPNVGQKIKIKKI